MNESRHSLLSWANELLAMNITKIEEFGTGALYCHIVDSVYNDVPLNRVKFNARQEFEYVNNFKILQDAFTRHSIKRKIPVDQLIKCRMLDNLEFVQWMKRWWETVYPGDYKPLERRQQTGAVADGPAAGAGAATAGPARRPVAVASRPVPARATTPAPAGPGAAGSVAGAGVGTRPAAASSRSAPVSGRSTSTSLSPTLSASDGQSAPAAGSAGAGQPSDAALSLLSRYQEQVQSLSESIAERDLIISGLKSDVDFYFSKLREVEIVVQRTVLQLQGAGDGTATDPAPSVEQLLAAIQSVMYRVADGYEIPAGAPPVGAPTTAPSAGAPTASMQLDEPEEF